MTEIAPSENTPKSIFPDVGIVVPCYNEEAVVPLLLERLVAVTNAYQGHTHILFVNDGSSDSTMHLLHAACIQYPFMACLSFSRNFGHQAAVTAGLKYIRGDVVLVIDADLQDPPELLPKMIEKWREGYEVIYGVRMNRKEHVLLKASYSIFYRLLQRISNVDIPLDAGDFALMDRQVVDQLNVLPEHNRFVRGLRGWVGFRQIGLSYERQARLAGNPKYGFLKLLQLAMNGFVSFSAVPLKLASWSGCLSAVLGLGMLIWVIISKVGEGNPPPGWASLAAIFLIFSGIQLLVLGIIGDYIGRIFDEVKLRPNFVVQSISGWLSERNRTTQSSTT